MFLLNVNAYQRVKCFFQFWHNHYGNESNKLFIMTVMAEIMIAFATVRCQYSNESKYMHHQVNAHTIYITKLL